MSDPCVRTRLFTGEAAYKNSGSLEFFFVLKVFFRDVGAHKGYIFGVLASLLSAAGALVVIGLCFRSLTQVNFEGQNFSSVIAPIITLIGAGIFLAFSSLGRVYYVGRLAEASVFQLRYLLFHKIFSQPATFYEKAQPGPLLSYFQGNIETIQSFLATSLPIFVRNLLIFIGAVSMMVYMSPQLSFSVLMALPIMIGPLFFFSKRLRSLSRLTHQQNADFSSVLEEFLSAFTLIRLFQMQDAVCAQLETKAYDMGKTLRYFLKYRCIFVFILVASAFLFIGFVLLLGFYYVIHGTLSSGDLLAFLFYALAVAGILNSSSEHLSDIHKTIGVLAYLQEFLHAPEEKECFFSRVSPINSAVPVLIDNLSFFYPERSDFILKQIDCTIQAHQFVALVGPSGSGKSTILKLLTRFLKTNPEKIFIYGQCIQKYSEEDLYALISFVPQETKLFSGTLYNNIALANPAASSQDIKNAATLALVTEFAQDLPQGLETEVGYKGYKLSAGQQQRIAIARALVRNTPIIVMDEPTSALDAQGEQEIQATLHSLKNKKTIIVVSHRLATIQSADCIFVLHKGCLVAQGSHEQLLINNPLYKSLADLQIIH